METIKNKNRKQRGVAAIITALCLFVLLGVAAFAVDTTVYFLRLNELQNAADAGALAGARVLYDPVTKLVNTNANQVGHDIAEKNEAQNTFVEVDWDTNSENSTADVRRGHWSFLNREFTPIDTIEPVDILDHTTEELDNPNSNFVNALEVTTWRDAVPVLSFFASIFGINNLKMKATAVAYLGFAGNILSFEVDLPIALCEDTLLFEDGNYNCTIGRMINSGSQTGTNDTARWTDFSDTEQCTDQSGINTSTMTEVVQGPNKDCDGGNPEEIPFGSVIATGQGENAPIIADIKDCFQSMFFDEVNGTYDMWAAKLPVVDCSNNIYNNNCSPVIGVAGVHIAWVNDKQDMKYRFVPKFMYGPKDEEGNLILDENDNPIFSSWPGDSPGSYTNVLKEELEPFIADLWTYYESNEQNDFKNLAQDLAETYPAGWTVEDLFVDQGLDVIDPNGVVLRSEDEIDGKARWASFIQHFDLNNVDADEYTGELIMKPAPWRSASVYFLPSCKVDVQTGGTGGKNFGILAKIPVLVD